MFPCLFQLAEATCTDWLLIPFSSHSRLLLPLLHLLTWVLLPSSAIRKGPLLITLGPPRESKIICPSSDPSFNESVKYLLPCIDMFIAGSGGSGDRTWTLIEGPLFRLPQWDYQEPLKRTKIRCLWENDSTFVHQRIKIMWVE